jgi:hypothetical protein
MTGEALQTALVRLNYGLINIGLMLFHPGQEGWSEVEADLGIIVYNAYDSML